MAIAACAASVRIASRHMASHAISSISYMAASSSDAAPSTLYSALQAARAGPMQGQQFTSMHACEGHASSRGLSTSSDADQAHFQVIPMPKLSHVFTHGRLVKWLKKAGDPVDMYEVRGEVRGKGILACG
jgi:hypothetical protein